MPSLLSVTAEKKWQTKVMAWNRQAYGQTGEPESTVIKFYMLTTGT